MNDEYDVPEMNERCRVCAYCAWERFYDTEGNTPVFECRHRSPAAYDNGTARWPIVNPNTVCGDFTTDRGE